MFGVGLLLTLFPFVSVVWVTGEALDRLPEIEASEIETDRNWTAMFSDGFVLATRSYSGVSGEAFADALVLDGFELATASGEQLWSKDCCGEYDAVRVRVEASGDGQTVAAVSVYDEDVQATWPFVSGLGVLVSFLGLAVAKPHFRRAGNSR